MTVHIGADQAKAVADAHGENNPDDPESAMDRHNNHVGRTLGATSEAEAESRSSATAEDGPRAPAP